MPAESPSKNSILVETSEKPRVFFFHYNKPSSQRAKKPQISIHYKDTCHIVDNLTCNCKVHGHIGKRQPYFVMKGNTTRLEIVQGYATIS